MNSKENTRKLLCRHWQIDYKISMKCKRLIVVNTILKESWKVAIIRHQDSIKLSDQDRVEVEKYTKIDQ
jgi:hypothetical protein